MTLILSLATRENVIQVSDQRITNSRTGKVLSDTTNKGTIVLCRDARFSIAYTGIAWKGNGQKTDQWIVESLKDFDLGNKVLPEVIEHLRMSATKKFNGDALSFDCVGFATFGLCIPFFCKISNFEHGEEMMPGKISDDFSSYCILPKEGTGKAPFALIGSGAETAMKSKTFTNHIKKLKKKGDFINNDPKAIADCMVSLVRAASHDKNIDGKLIGRFCIATLLPVDPCQQAQSYYYGDVNERSYGYSPDYSGVLKIMPNLVGPSGAFCDTYVWVGAGDPPWWKNRTKPPGWEGYWPNYSRQKK